MIDMQKLLADVGEMKRILPDIKPDCALILGSGWSSVVAGLPSEDTIEYSSIPALGATGVAGHTGRMSFIEWNGVRVLVFQGRRHWYEGVGWNPVVFPVMLAHSLGAENLLLTNAAGGIRKDLLPGTFMVINDHINMMSANPLQGKHYPELGPRFPDQTEVYSKIMRDIMDKAGQISGIRLPHGVYLATSGPTYETPAEVNVYREMGADAVGMSTVPEAIMANAMDMKIGAISCITNSAAGISVRPLSHQDVIGATDGAKENMKMFLSEFFSLLKQQL